MTTRIESTKVKRQQVWRCNQCDGISATRGFGELGYCGEYDTYYVMLQSPSPCPNGCEEEHFSQYEEYCSLCEAGVVDEVTALLCPFADDGDDDEEKWIYTDSTAHGMLEVALLQHVENYHATAAINAWWRWMVEIVDA